MNSFPLYVDFSTGAGYGSSNGTALSDEQYADNGIMSPMIKMNANVFFLIMITMIHHDGIGCKY